MRAVTQHQQQRVVTANNSNSNCCINNNSDNNPSRRRAPSSHSRCMHFRCCPASKFQLDPLTHTATAHRRLCYVLLLHQYATHHLRHHLRHPLTAAANISSSSSSSSSANNKNKKTATTPSPTATEATGSSWEFTGCRPTSQKAHWAGGGD